MADVSKIKLPDGTTYNIKDTVSGYITTVPVTSVNEQTGDVTIVEGLTPLVGTTETVTPQQVMTALEEGRDICISAHTRLLDIATELKFTAWTRATDTIYNGQALDVVVSQTVARFSGVWGIVELVGGIDSGASKPWAILMDTLVTSVNGDAGIVQVTVPTALSELTNDSGFITGYTETDPTVPSWAKASTKPTYTASEVGAIPVSRTINGKALSNDITLDASDIGINPASVAPNMDGTAAVGTSSKYAREDHVHPTDTSRQANLGITSLSIGTDEDSGIQFLDVAADDFNTSLLTAAGLLTVNNIIAQTYVAKSSVGAASGVAPLDANSKVDSQYLPSYLIKGNTGGVFYGTCSTAAGTVAKVVECTDFAADNLKAGAIIIVSFTTTNSGAVANLTMNVNNTGAKPIKYINNGTLGNLSSAGYIKANTEYPFYYDGANWVVWFNCNTTYSAMTESEMHTGTATTARLITAQRLKQAVEYHAPKELPTVATTDVGKFLRVSSSGIWVAEAVPSAESEVY